MDDADDHPPVTRCPMPDEARSDDPAVRAAFLELMRRAITQETER